MTTSLHTNWALTICKDIEQAKQSISITALSMHQAKATAPSNYAALFYALTLAIKRGVLVNIYLPQASKNHPATLQNETTLAVLYKLGARCHLIPYPSLLHAKTCLIDNFIVYIGSGNWTAAAASLNREIYMRCMSEVLAAELNGHIANLVNYEFQEREYTW